jgi:hypothetical protein
MLCNTAINTTEVTKILGYKKSYKKFLNIRIKTVEGNIKALYTLS